MNEILTLAILPGVLWAFLMFIRMPAVTFTLSILVGKLFAEQLPGGVYDTINKLLPVNDTREIQLFLLLLPVVLTIILTHSKTGATKTLTNSLLLLFASISLILFALPYTDLLGRLGEEGQSIVSSYRDYITCATGGIALLFAWSPDLRKSRRRK